MEMKSDTKPKIFIGSSTESLDISYAIQQNLEREADVTVWTQGIFQPSRTSLDSLLRALGENDFGIFVFTGDDLITIRDAKKSVTRDNVVFELGLFIGRLGQERSFIVKPREEELHLPTDIIGLTLLDFPTDRDDKNLMAALGPACHIIRGILKDLGNNDQNEEEIDISSQEERHTEADSVVMLTSWVKSNYSDLHKQAIFYKELDDRLNLYPGTSKNHLIKLASENNYIVDTKSENSVLFKRGPMRVKTEVRGRTFGEW